MGSCARKLTTWNRSQAYFVCSPWQVSFITPSQPAKADTAGNSTGLSSHPAQACQLGTQSLLSSERRPLEQKSTLCPSLHCTALHCGLHFVLGYVRGIRHA